VGHGQQRGEPTGSGVQHAWVLTLCRFLIERQFTETWNAAANFGSDRPRTNHQRAPCVLVNEIGVDPYMQDSPSPFERSRGFSSATYSSMVAGNKAPCDRLASSMNLLTNGARHCDALREMLPVRTR
jgi:hypothetical protein